VTCTRPSGYGCQHREPLRVLTDHTDAVLGVAFSPDSTKFVSASKDKTAIVWEAVTANRFGPFGAITILFLQWPTPRWPVGCDGRSRSGGQDLGPGKRFGTTHPQGPFQNRHERGGVARRTVDRPCVSGWDGHLVERGWGVTWKPARDSERSSDASASKSKTQTDWRLALSRDAFAGGSEGWELCVHRASVGLQASEVLLEWRVRTPWRVYLSFFWTTGHAGPWTPIGEW